MKMNMYINMKKYHKILKLFSCSQDKTARAGQPGQDSRDRTAGTGQQGQDSRDRTA